MDAGRRHMKQLETAIGLENYTLRVPKGYQMQEAKNAPAGFKAIGWIGTGPGDRTGHDRPSP